MAKDNNKKIWYRGFMIGKFGSTRKDRYAFQDIGLTVYPCSSIKFAKQAIDYLIENDESGIYKEWENKQKLMHDNLKE